MLLEDKADFSIVADTNWRQNVDEYRESDYVRCSERSSRDALGKPVDLISIDSDLGREDIDAEWMGMLKIRSGQRDFFSEQINSVLKNNEKAQIPDLISSILGSETKVNVIYTSGHWIDIDSLEDLMKASHF